MQTNILFLIALFLAIPVGGETADTQNSQRILKQRIPKKLKWVSPPPAEKTEEQEEKSPRPTGLSRYSVTVLPHTSSFNQTTYYRSFKSFGGQILISVPITQWATHSWVSLESGIGALYSKVSVPQPNVDFSRTQFSIPFLAKVSLALSPRWTGEVFVGLVYQPYFFDSRDNTSGGFQKNEEGLFQPEGGLGLRYFLGPSLRLKIRASYLYVGGGLEILI